MKQKKGFKFLIWALFPFFSFNLFGKISITITPSFLSLNLKENVLYDSQIQILNSGDIDYDVYVSFYDIEQLEDGEIEKFEPNTIKRGIGGWLSSDVKSFPLKSGEKYLFKYYINVPKGVYGGYAGGILFTIKTKKEAQEFGTGIEAGILSKIYIISEEKKGILNFEDFKILKSENENTYYFSISLKNKTPFFSDFGGIFYLKDEKGETIYEKKISSERKVFPEKLLNLRYPIEKIKKGNLIGILVLNLNEEKPLIKTIYFRVD